MSDKDFMELAKQAVADYYNENLDYCDAKKCISMDDVYIVWMVRVIQNNKAMLSTNVADGMYYEVTFDGDKKKLYIAGYRHWRTKEADVRL